MELDIKKIMEITTGAVRIEEEKDGIHFYRFTKKQEEFYKNYGREFYYMQTFATAGIKLSFVTNSKRVSLKVLISEASCRKYFSLDVMKDGEKIGSIDNFENVTFPPEYIGIDLPLEGEYQKEFETGDGEKEIVIHLPWSARCVIKSILVDDGAFVRANKYDKCMLIYGDSITHGYDAVYSCNRYAAKICEMLKMQEISKAIGGERFNPLLADIRDDFTPDSILVAYGTNDISCDGLEVTLKHCRGFFENLSGNYPDTVIYVITPIWRGDWERVENFDEMTKGIKKIAKDYKNIKVAEGFELVPGDKKYFADLFLHPTDEGFDYYAKNLYKIISEK